MAEIKVTVGQVSGILAEELYKQQRNGTYVDVLLIFNCGHSSWVHNGVIAAMSSTLTERLDSMTKRGFVFVPGMFKLI